MIAELPPSVSPLTVAKGSNGATEDQIKRSNKLGIHNWADRFVGRGVLIDACKYRLEAGCPVNPLTDEKIALMLKEEGISVTRRSITKYREDLKIPSTHQRRVRS